MRAGAIRNYRKGVYKTENNAWVYEALKGSFAHLASGRDARTERAGSDHLDRHPAAPKTAGRLDGQSEATPLHPPTQFRKIRHRDLTFDFSKFRSIFSKEFLVFQIFFPLPILDGVA